jgi:hypothetical protein
MAHTSTLDGFSGTLVEDWQNGGGETIRKEYAAQLALPD